LDSKASLILIATAPNNVATGIKLIEIGSASRRTKWKKSAPKTPANSDIAAIV